jgi:hypothetical protein
MKNRNYADRLVAVAMQPIGKAVDVFSGGTGAKPTTSDR